MSPFVHVLWSTEAGAFAVTWENTDPRIAVYRWSSSGFGTTYSAPGTLFGGRGRGCQFSHGNDAIAASSQYADFVHAWAWNDGFGTKFTSPSSPPVASFDIEFSVNDDSIISATSASPYVWACGWSSSGFGTKYSDPSTLPTGTNSNVKLNAAGDVLMCPHRESPWATAYPWNAGFGTKYANPSTLPSTLGYGVNAAWHGDGTAVALCGGVYGNDDDRLNVYAWSSGWGVKYANPAVKPPNIVQDAVFIGDDLIVSHYDTPYISAYPWLAGVGFGTKYANPSPLPAGNGNGVTALNETLGMGHTSSPYVAAYPWLAGVGFGTKYANPSTLIYETGIKPSFTYPTGG